MATFSQTVAGAEDCVSYDQGTGADPTPFIGRYDGTANGADICGLRFTNVTIPQGATINSASITVTAVQMTAGSPNLVNLIVSLYCEDVDDAAAWSLPFTRNPHTASATPTSAVVTGWTPSAESGSITTPSLVGPIQEVVNRGSWASGNDLVVLIDGTSQAAVAELELTAATAQLNIDYTAAGGRTASVSATLATLACSATGASVEQRTANASATLATLTASATGTLTGRAKAPSILIVTLPPPDPELTRRREPLIMVSPALGPIEERTATVSATLATLAVAATGALAIQGAASGTLATLTASATGALRIQAAASATLATFTASSTATLPIRGGIAAPIATFSSASSATLAIQASASGTLASLTMDASASVGSGVTATVSATLATFTLEGTGALAIQASVSGTLATLAVAAEGAQSLQGAVVSSPLATFTLEATGTLAIQGGIDGILATLTLSAQSGAGVGTGSLDAEFTVYARCDARAYVNGVATMPLASERVPVYRGRTNVFLLRHLHDRLVSAGVFIDSAVITLTITDEAGDEVFAATVMPSLGDQTGSYRLTTSSQQFNPDTGGYYTAIAEGDFLADDGNVEYREELYLVGAAA